jgi:hypothetical protein
MLKEYKRDTIIGVGLRPICAGERLLKVFGRTGTFVPARIGGARIYAR